MGVPCAAAEVCALLGCRSIVPCPKLGQPAFWGPVWVSPAPPAFCRRQPCKKNDPEHLCLFFIVKIDAYWMDMVDGSFLHDIMVTRISMQIAGGYWIELSQTAEASSLARCLWTVMGNRLGGGGNANNDCPVEGGCQRD